MARLHLIRHGHAAAGWGEDADPGLDEAGLAQAAAMAGELAAWGPWPVVCSPLQRTRVTATALERQWGQPARVDPRVGEVPSPTGPEGELANRGKWLAGVMAGRWDDPGLSSALSAWRAGVLEALLAIEEQTAVVSHFVAINVAVGEATGDLRAVCFRPGYCSRTVLDNEGGRLRLIELGPESSTVVR